MPSGTTERLSDEASRQRATGTDDSAVAVLEAFARHRDAEAAMHRRTRDRMHLGDTDLRALRWIIREERTGRPPSSAGLARALEITTAAAAKLVGRLVDAGYLVRDRDPADARVLLLRTRSGAHDRIRDTLGAMHDRMLVLAESYGPVERRILISFLDGLAGAVDGE